MAAITSQWWRRLMKWRQVWCVCNVKTVWSIPERFRGKLLMMGRYVPYLFNDNLVVSAEKLVMCHMLLSGWTWERKECLLCDGLHWRYARVDARHEPGRHCTAASRVPATYIMCCDRDDRYTIRLASIWHSAAVWDMANSLAGCQLSLVSCCTDCK